MSDGSNRPDSQLGQMGKIGQICQMGQRGQIGQMGQICQFWWVGVFFVKYKDRSEPQYNGIKRFHLRQNSLRQRDCMSYLLHPLSSWQS